MQTNQPKKMFLMEAYGYASMSKDGREVRETPKDCADRAIAHLGGTKVGGFGHDELLAAIEQGIGFEGSVAADIVDADGREIGSVHVTSVMVY